MKDLGSRLRPVFRSCIPLAYTVLLPLFTLLISERGVRFTHPLFTLLMSEREERQQTWIHPWSWFRPSFPGPGVCPHFSFSTHYSLSLTRTVERSARRSPHRSMCSLFVLTVHLILESEGRQKGGTERWTNREKENTWDGGG